MEAAPAFLIVLVPFALVLLVVYFSYKQRKARIAALTAFAASRGWQYQQADVYGLPQRWRGTPFDDGYGKRAENVLTGELGGRPLVAFDYEYKTDSSDGRGNRSTTTHRFTVCVLRMPGALPDLQVAPEGFFSRIGQALGMSDIELESEDFNRAYRVRCRNPKLASDVLHPRTMELLLRCDPRLRFRFEGADVLAWSTGHASPGAIVGSASVLAELVDGVPDFVWKDHAS